ncbi:MAG: DUF1592 domain-containing protein [Acidobacteria bacterium]|nr:DUF1592 domain-containing protein [Acidobacteriota bacterium]
MEFKETLRQWAAGCLRAVIVVWFAVTSATAQPTPVSYSQADALKFLGSYCQACHQGDSAAAKFRVADLGTVESFRTHPDSWTRLAARVANSEMPPKGAPVPDLDAREQFLNWVESTWRSQACAADVKPAPHLIRRLNRDEYAATIRDLFDLQLDFREALPIDGPGGEGFDNAAETLFLSPLHSEKYVEIAKHVVDAASKEFKSRVKIFVARPGPDTTEEQAAGKILVEFLPKAFRHPIDEETVRDYVELFRFARRQDQDFEPAIFFALRSALVSPRFLFHVEPAGNDPELRQYALASKFSYFLWGTMPDAFLFDIAAAGKMDDPKVLRELVPRMLRDPRSLEFSTRFVEQWLRTRELEGSHRPDRELFPQYSNDEELHSDILLQPVFFFQYVLRENKSLLSFLDSDYTILTGALAKHFAIETEEKTSKNPEWMKLPQGSNRGGLLSMPAVLAVSSHPYRTSPVLRGVWILDSILGASPPPPPPNVPPLKDQETGETPKSMREMLTQHRVNPACASCHDRIDPLGFALDNYDVIGRWRDEEAGGPVDATGELTDGTKIDGPAGLKQALIERKELFIRNLTKRMLGYAVGRGLTPADACAVETIVDRVAVAGYQPWTLISEIAVSAPFQEPLDLAEDPR